ncbi:MAG: PEP-CTERM sorting domain-containing protein [Sedimentisphaerales bacterium]|nr:PEP-CTERM sorting domain-containing protein [Sedimentisphaerales bacterium]
MGKKRTIISLCVAVVLFLSSGANACLNTVTIEHDGYGASGQATLWGGGLEGYQGTAGVYMLEKTAGSGEGEQWDNGDIPAFCIELTQYSPGDPKIYDVVQPQNAQSPTTFLGEKIGQAKADSLRELWGRYFDNSWAAGGSYTSEQNAAAEAFAAAVWEIVYEDMPSTPAGWNVTADGTCGALGFRAENINSDLANSMLHSLDGTGPHADLRAFVNAYNQDFLVEVPEPATVFILGFGSLALLRSRKRK